MKAVVFREYGTAEVLELVDIPRPEPEARYILIKIRAAAVNPADSKWRQGMFQSFAPVLLPHILGYDVAGIIEAVGTDVSGFDVGDRVVVMLDSATKGGYAEYVIAPAENVVAIPEGMDFATAAAIPTAGLTGVQMVEDYADVRDGQHVLITGAVGSVGRFALSAARDRGAHIVAAVRPSHALEARTLGATTILSLGKDEWSGRAFDHVIDTIGGDEVATLCRHVRSGGGIFTASTNPISSVGLTTEPVFVVVRQDARRLRQLTLSVEVGAPSVPIFQKFPLSHFKEAQGLVEKGGNAGKIILEP